jgi:phosphoribosyl 1,2-cyclic phosphodiesterase
VKISVLASGSAGNALYVEAAGARLLLDAGISPRELARRLECVPSAPSPDRLDAVLLTHEHSDHAGHAQALSARGLRTIATYGTLRELAITENTTVIEPNRRFQLGELSILPVPVPHDAAEPVAFVLECEGGRVGVVTDCGHASAEVAAALAGCTVLVLEANHDPSMLRYGNYPPSLKRRIGGRRGHLSNEEAAQLLRLIPGPLPRCVVLAHLSNLNNRPSLARAAVGRVIGRRPVRMLVATQGRVLAPISIGGGRIEIADGLPGEQLTLPLSAPPLESS